MTRPEVVRRTRASLFLLTALLLPTQLVAQGAGQQDPMAALAGALLRLEYALAERPPAPEAIAGVNRAFDAATLAFFAGQVDQVLAQLDVLTAEVEPDAETRERQAREALAVLMSLPAKARRLAEPYPAVPFRLEGPADPGSEPLPVVIALHGAGGNEHMFVEAYGAGRLRTLADSERFVVISPFTNALGAAGPEGIGRALEGLLEAAEAEYPIDRNRVVVMGHSMGAGVAWQLVQASRAGASPVQAVACLGGPCGVSSTGSLPAADGLAPVPPLLLIAGELDPLAAPARMQQAAEAAGAQGVRVTYREMADQGHTLLVGAVLEDVVAWLLNQL